jgi:two-component system, cell cycle response regulator DivK
MNRGTILVVEDNPVNMELATDLLESAGYAVLQAADAEAGIELARTQRVDLVLMDIALPGMDGLRATSILKSDARTRGLTIIALTAHAMKGDEEKALEVGCAAYVTKPIATRELLSTVDSYIRRAAALAMAA